MTLTPIVVSSAAGVEASSSGLALNDSSPTLRSPAIWCRTIFAAMGTISVETSKRWYRLAEEGPAHRPWQMVTSWPFALTDALYPATLMPWIPKREPSTPTRAHLVFRSAIAAAYVYGRTRSLARKNGASPSLSAAKNCMNTWKRRNVASGREAAAHRSSVRTIRLILRFELSG